MESRSRSGLDDILSANIPARSRHSSIKIDMPSDHFRQPLLPNSSLHESKDEISVYGSEARSGSYSIHRETVLQPDSEISQLRAELQQMRIRLQIAEADNAHLRECLARECALDRIADGLLCDDSKSTEQKISSGNPDVVEGEELGVPENSKELLVLSQSILQLIRQPSGSPGQNHALDEMEQAMESMADHLDSFDRALVGSTMRGDAYDSMIDTVSSATSAKNVLYVRESLAERIYHIAKAEVDDNTKKGEEHMIPIDIETFTRVCQILVNERDEMVQRALEMVENSNGEALAMHSQQGFTARNMEEKM